MEHTIYLAAKAFIDKVKPQTRKNKTSTKNSTASVEDADDDDDDDDWISDWNQLEELPDDEEVDNVMDFTAGDVLGKTLALVNQVSLVSFVLSLCLHVIDSCFSSSEAVLCILLHI
jgi:hypothetical protein